MTPIMRSLFYLSLLLAPLLVHAGMKIGGIELSNSYKIEEESLVLNGAGIRSKFFVKIYVGAIYLPETTLDSDQILAAAGPKSMQMNMLYKEVEAEKITTGWTEGFSSNLSDIDFELVRSGMLKEITMADKVILYGRKTVLLSIEKSADFSKGSKTIALPYYVQNMLVAPEKPLEVRLSLAIE